MTVYKGQSVTLDCQAVLHERIIWRYISQDDKNDVRIVYSKNKIYKAYLQRFRISRPERGVFDLVISRVNASDAGTYKCIENKGEHPGEACTELHVTGETNLISELKNNIKYTHL